jgi:hypothetical protein
MDYRYSEHYKEDLHEEIDAALAANSPSSVETTLETRLLTESRQAMTDVEAIQRIEQQLAYLALVTSEVEVAA